MILELEGLAIFGRHGVLEDGASDRIEDAVDYREVADCVREVSAGRDFNLIEALGQAVADALVVRFPVRSVRVRVTKTNPAGVGARYAVVSVERASG